MNFRPLLRGAALALSTLAVSTATWAQAPFSSLKLEFTQPTGTVGSAEAIPVYVKLTNTDSTRDFVFDSSLPLGGLGANEVPTSGNLYDAATGQNTSVDFAAYTSVRLGASFACTSGNFISNVCTPGAYTFSWTHEGAVFGDALRLVPSQSFEYLLGTFNPTGGSAPAGVYELLSTTLWLDVNGVDASGNALWQYAFPVSTCNWSNAADCSAHGLSFFTRTVTAVPEPTTALMLWAGLLGLAALRRRR